MVVVATSSINAQGGILRRVGSGGLPSGSGAASDSFERRNRFEDSITIYYRYLDSSRNYFLDSSLNDFSKRFPVPYTYHYLGNPGTAAKSILFHPAKQTGFTPGFPAFDVYRWSIDKVRFFTATRPYTELGYVLGSQAQQIIEVMHTQNFKPHWNISLNYRLINAPGFFKNQHTNHNNYLFTSWYNSPNRRYNNFLILVGNKLQTGENGGIQTGEDYLNDPTYDDRLSVPVKLGSGDAFSRNLFNDALQTGNRSRDFTALMRQQYDLGRKDSLVTDSTVIPLFFPRLRFEHTFKTSQFQAPVFATIQPTLFIMMQFYGVMLRDSIDTIQRTDKWRELSNDFSIYQFPDAKNLQQFIKAGH